MTRERCADFAREIRARLGLRRALERYGVSFNAHGFALCPFHGEKTPSFRVREDDTAYHCFGCGAHGDVIDFVQRTQGLSFQEAVRQINGDFGLELPVGRRLSLRQQRAAEERRDARLAAASQKRDAIRAYEARRDALWDEWARLDHDRRAYAPKSPEEPLDGRYVYALHRIDRVEYRIDALAYQKEW